MPISMPASFSPTSGAVAAGAKYYKSGDGCCTKGRAFRLMRQSLRLLALPLFPLGLTPTGWASMIQTGLSDTTHAIIDLLNRRTDRKFLLADRQPNMSGAPFFARDTGSLLGTLGSYDEILRNGVTRGSVVIQLLPPGALHSTWNDRSRVLPSGISMAPKDAIDALTGNSYTVLEVSLPATMGGQRYEKFATEDMRKIGQFARELKRHGEHADNKVRWRPSSSFFLIAYPKNLPGSHENKWGCPTLALNLAGELSKTEKTFYVNQLDPFVLGDQGACIGVGEELTLNKVNGY